MTREEAIAFFKDMNECTYGNLEAVEMAIKALEQEPCEDCIKIPEGATNEDMIKAMFPKAWRSNYIDSTNKFTLYIDDDHELEVDNDWWNSPYRKDKE